MNRAPSSIRSSSSVSLFSALTHHTPWYRPRLRQAYSCASTDLPTPPNPFTAADGAAPLLTDAEAATLVSAAVPPFLHSAASTASNSASRPVKPGTPRISACRTCAPGVRTTSTCPRGATALRTARAKPSASSSSGTRST